MRIIVYGTVQGVGFRPMVYRVAMEMSLNGYVRNMGTCVEICIDGDVKSFMGRLKAVLPTLARIERYEVLDGEPDAPGFRIVRSGEGQRASFLPPDTALCEDCIVELSDPDNRRYRYPFTNCTDCGARYTVMTDAPFDRERTTMAQFKRCATCTAEYTSPVDRRFHAQTSSCRRCGPHYMLYGSDGGVMDAGDPFTVFAAHIDSGSIGIMKSWGGSHAVCIPGSIGRLRELYGRRYKPFAVMVRDVAIAEKYARLNGYAKELLSSPQAPIVLLGKKRGGWLDDAAPGLDRIGLYIPHAGAQHILFQSLEADAVVMTSANMPGHPMAVLNQDCLKLPADIYLLHNRFVANRMDDSVVLPRGKGFFFARKSRGFVPDVLQVPHNRSVLALGADMSGCGFVCRDGRGVATQHIGDMGNYDSSIYMEESVGALMRFSGIERESLEALVVDLHPLYSSRRLGIRLSREWSVPLMEVQHHAAHLYGLMSETEGNDMVALACDGTGYGTDGTIWGGEVLASSDADAGYDRLAHLSPIPMLGGEKAVEDPRRMCAGICLQAGIKTPWFSDTEEDLFKKSLPRCVSTSSAGRYLDLVSAWLGICTEMTYDGEPAIRLERYLERGRDLQGLEACVVSRDGIAEVDTRCFLSSFADILAPVSSPDSLTERQKADYAVAMVEPVFRTLSRVAGEHASKRGLKEAGFTGGVSYNLVLDRMVKKGLGETGVGILRHRRTPNGDGGVSYGQAVMAGSVLL